ncbi:uncharacterized protein SCHCODRAFT_02748310 [Schizophyllum commune H4-8]|uniref:uncharacterized protein n=1 Tax=Schizophyllum commune (strain H4-8 / FGSC 9210) TaxID=578458 RepID=UPI00215F2A20|nr:uncharacterized protein SCHCODRAFT_02748310 [Schizophyllum commune H4-8]KAI5891942.1 hypothetical protein SCHCODRAFT_02748310 [Schizophyllum commune H4-8]
MAPLPWQGTYAVISLDPAASLWDIDDAIVREQIAKLKCGRYVATASKEHHALSGPTPFRLITWDLLVQGIPPTEQDRHFEFYQTYQTVPVFPTTEHPERRRPVEPLPHLPWENCYHARMYRKVAICANRGFEETPPSCLSPDEAAVLDQYQSADIDYTKLSRQAKEERRAPPPHNVPAQVLSAIHLADKRKRTDGKSWWEICRERAQTRMQEEASTAIASGSVHPEAQTKSKGDAFPSSPQKNNTTAGENSSKPAAAALTTIFPTNVAEATQERDKSVSTISGASSSTLSTDRPEDVLAALLELHGFDDHHPWIKVESYDIKQFDVPPDPTRFFAELFKLEMPVADLCHRLRFCLLPRFLRSASCRFSMCQCTSL